MRDVDRMGGFAKGLSVIEAFGRGRNRLTIAEVARQSGLDRASARRCLLTLVEAGYAAADDRYFELTPRILRLGHSYLAASLPRLIQPTLNQLSDRLQESCSAAVLDGKDVIYIARSAQNRIVGAGLHAGSRLPAYCSTLGRSMLAALPADRARAILESSDRTQLTERTLTGIDDLMAELDRIRAAGYAYIDQELEIGSRSVAVPIRNLSNRTVAAINVGLHVSRGTPERVQEEILPALFDVQAQLAEILP
ncbi:helix-turn-helix domain-containing protein [Sphingomonas sp. CGMCC 1.13654]|uniref:Helix-turn-helix domain-containing protein n=1 Tax=Sphingomonas chungangi TaxID=2683589 RepID=A0A838L874_9SPHN|nr:helix-turn-helix domain-containing protein [Sphingomonas chungangi]MVW55069.1 helix-turn-helix domain-containing protein [Sphingomonas chungangi]